MKQLLSFILLFTILAYVPAQTNKQIRNLKSKSSKLQTTIKKSEQRLSTTKRDVRTQLSNLSLLSGQIDKQRHYVEGIEKEVFQLSDNITQLQAELKMLQKELADKKEKYSKSLVYLYRNRSTQDKLMFIFSANNFSQLIRRVRYVREYANYQRVQGEQLQVKELQVKNKQKELLKAKSDKDKLLRQGQTEKQKLEVQHNERQQIVNGLQKQQKQLQAVLKESRSQYNALNAQIDNLIRQEIIAAEKRRKAAAEAAARKKAAAEKAARERAAREQAEAKRKRQAEAEAKRTGKTVKNKVKDEPAYEAPSRENVKMEAYVDPDAKISNSFAASRGRMPMPVTTGYTITSHYGQYSVQGLSGVQLDNKGINISCPAGASARSIFEGEVTAVSKFGDIYIVIIRHGNYLSSYCNLSSASVRRGQHVSARQTLGTIAGDGTGRATLHFKLNKEMSSINPEPWLAR